MDYSSSDYSSSDYSSESDYIEIKPLLKWVGGKSKIMDKVIDNIPKNLIIIMNHFWEELVFF